VARPGVADSCMGSCRAARKRHLACLRALDPSASPRAGAGENGAARTIPPAHHQVVDRWHALARQTVAWGRVAQRANDTSPVPGHSIRRTRRAPAQVRMGPSALPSAAHHQVVDQWQALSRQTVAWGRVAQHANDTSPVPGHSLRRPHRAAARARIGLPAAHHQVVDRQQALAWQTVPWVVAKLLAFATAVRARRLPATRRGTALVRQPDRRPARLPHVRCHTHRH